MVGPGVVIDAVTAPAVLVLLRDGLRRAEREHWQLAEETRAILRALEALADHASTMAPAPPPGEPD